MEVFVRTDEGCADQPFLLWDSVWNPDLGAADWALAGPGETFNRGGLKATAALETAVVLSLFTDRRCPPDHPLAKYADTDKRGYWGDGVDVRTDLGETELGSLLWLLERSVATKEVAQWAQSLALDALAPLVAQGAVVTAEATAALLPAFNGMTLQIALYGQNGARIYDRRFEVVWNQINAAPSASVVAQAALPDLLALGQAVDFGLASDPAFIVTDFGLASDGRAFLIDLGAASL